MFHPWDAHQANYRDMDDPKTPKAVAATEEEKKAIKAQKLLDKLLSLKRLIKKQE